MAMDARAAEALSRRIGAEQPIRRFIAICPMAAFEQHRRCAFIQQNLPLRQHLVFIESRCLAA